MSDKKRSLGKPISQVREDLRNDPNTIAIVKHMGVDIEEYIDMVIDYGQNPDKEPELDIAPDHELKAADPDFVGTQKDVEDWLKGVNEGEIELGPKSFKNEFKADFGEDEDSALTATGKKRAFNPLGTGTGERGEIKVDANSEAGQALKDQLKGAMSKQHLRGKVSKDGTKE